MVEADLANEGHDLRDLFRPGSGMTLRRLYVLVSGLPPHAGIWQAVQAAHEKSLKPTEQQLRERQARYRPKSQEAT